MIDLPKERNPPLVFQARERVPGVAAAGSPKREGSGEPLSGSREFAAEIRLA